MCRRLYHHNVIVELLFIPNDMDDGEISRLANELVIKVAQREYNIDNLDISVSSKGKKYFTYHNDIHFSISHKSRCIVVAVGKDNEIGIDVEEIHSIYPKIIDAFYCESEKQLIKRSDRPEYVQTAIWTKKEAYAKCTGEGLNKQNLSMDTTDDAIPYYFFSYQIEKYIISVCYAK